MSTPALIWLALAVLSVGYVAAVHGKPIQGTYSFWHRLVGLAISAGLLYWGGFFASVSA